MYPKSNIRNQNTSVADAEWPSSPSERTVRIVLSTVRAKGSSMHLESVAQRHAAPKLVQNTWPLGDGTQKQFLHGTNQCNPLGLPAKCSSNKSSRCSLAFQHPRFVHRSTFLAGTRLGFAKATARIRDIGLRWLVWLGSGREHSIVQMILNWRDRDFATTNNIVVNGESNPVRKL
jgi:hypothetical protein